MSSSSSSSGSSLLGSENVTSPIMPSPLSIVPPTSCDVGPSIRSKTNEEIPVPDFNKVADVDREAREAVRQYDLYLSGCGRRTRRITKSKKVTPKVERPSPSQTRSTEGSLETLRKTFSIPDDVDLVLPSSSDVVSAPPPGHFTLLESYFYRSYLWFPIPEAIVRLFHTVGLSFVQVPPRSFKHLVGVIIRGYEEGVEITSLHLENLFKWTVYKDSGLPHRYYCSPRKDRTVISEFQSKDDFWDKSFFYVPISDATVSAGCSDLVVTSWEPLGR